MKDSRLVQCGLMVLCLGIVALASTCAAQAPNASVAGGGASAGAFTNGAATTGVPGGSADIPPVNGINFTLNSTSQHNSLTGWSNVVTPNLSYRFNRHLSLGASVPWYLSVKNYVQTTAKGVTTYPLKEANNIIGDTSVSGHFEASHQDFSYGLTGTGGFATGNSQYGLSANSSTYNFTNHIEYSIGRFSPDIEIGEGDSSSLAHQSVKKSYTAVGQIANFQAGSSIDLPFKLGLDLEAYENMPIGNQKVYGTVSKKNKKGVTVTKQVLQGTGVAEDNGFTAELDIPLGRNLTLAGNYERSLRQGTDTAGFSLTWVMRAPKKAAAAH